jgi:hypothetical protein
LQAFFLEYENRSDRSNISDYKDLEHYLESYIRPRDQADLRIFNALTKEKCWYLCFMSHDR